ncbi:SRPBCC family protein [Sphingomonadaceae bacterium G21617-S1]|nr:SRPBCC family protein [Sphingomonadaceae bacterium G21617-S1]
MEIRNSFEVPLPPDQAWPVLMDIPGIIHCVPGADLTEKVDDRTYKGKVSVKLGPIALLFNGIATFEATDAVNHSATVKAQGTDAKGRGGANSTVRFSIVPVPGGSRVDVVTDVALSGMVAQYGRGTGLIQGVATQLINQFAASLRGMIEQGQAGGSDTDQRPVTADAVEAEGGVQPPASRAQAAPQQTSISGFSILLKALWSAISGLFARR